MNFVVKILISIIVSLLIMSLSSVIFNALDVESYVYTPYVSWFVLLVVLFIFIPPESPSIFNENNNI